MLKIKKAPSQHFKLKIWAYQPNIAKWLITRLCRGHRWMLFRRNGPSRLHLSEIAKDYMREFLTHSKIWTVTFKTRLMTWVCIKSRPPCQDGSTALLRTRLFTRRIRWRNGESTFCLSNTRMQLWLSGSISFLNASLFVLRRKATISQLLSWTHARPSRVVNLSSALVHVV